MGKKAPNAMAIPPIRGMGSQWIFLEFGISTSLNLHARLIKIGITIIVTIADKRNVENKIIWHLKMAWNAPPSKTAQIRAS